MVLPALNFIPAYKKYFPLREEISSLNVVILLAKLAEKDFAKLNFADRSDFAGIAEIVKELLGKSDDAWINPSIYCDYGSILR